MIWIIAGAGVLVVTTALLAVWKMFFVWDPASRCWTCERKYTDMVIGVSTLRGRGGARYRTGWTAREWNDGAFGALVVFRTRIGRLYVMIFPSPRFGAKKIEEHVKDLTIEEEKNEDLA